MKLLLTSQAIYNKSIELALRSLLPKPSGELNVVYIFTSQNIVVGDKSWLMQNLNSVYDMGWKSFEPIDLAAMDTLPRSMWWPRIEKADVLVVGGGANYYIGYWMERSGLTAALPELLKSKVYVGASAGSVYLTQSARFSSQGVKAYLKNHDWDFDLAALGPKGQSTGETMKLVNFELRPHYQSSNYPYMNDELFAEMAASVGNSLYALDDDSALMVVDGTVEIISEGKWKLFEGA